MRTINHIRMTVAIILALAFSPVLTAGGQQLLVSLSADSLGSSYVGIDSIRYGHHGPDSMVFAMKASLMELSGRRLPRQHRITVAPFLKDSAHHSIYTPPHRHLRLVGLLSRCAHADGCSCRQLAVQK